MAEKLPLSHPGEVLLEEFIKPLNLSTNQLASEIGVDARRIHEIVLGSRSVSEDTAVRLAGYFGVSPLFWLDLQAQYDRGITNGELGGCSEVEFRPRSMI